MSAGQHQSSPEYLSYSQVNTLRTCGEQYRLRYIEKAPRRPGCAMIGGTVIHSAADAVDEAILSGEANPESLVKLAAEAAELKLKSEIERAIEHSPEYTDLSTWQRYGRKTKTTPNAQDIDWYRAVAIPAAIQNYVSWRLKSAFLVPMNIPGWGPAIEVPFQLTIAGRQVRGYIDRVFVSTDTGVPVVVDLKSGQKPKTDEQLGLYATALRATLPGEFKWGAYLYGWKNPEKPATLTAPIDLSYYTDEMLSQTYGDAALAIDQSLFVPNPGEACFHCQLIDSCKFARSAI